MKIKETSLPGVFLIETDVYKDSRGFFMETWNEKRYKELGLDVNFIQDNLSYSSRGVLRGLHYQHPNPQGKLVYVVQGEIFDVAVDIRVGSPNFGKWVGIILSSENKKQLYIPEGFAHGFCVLSETALFAYKCTDFYNPQTEGGIIWNDSDINIEWPIISPELSQKDKSYGLLREISKEKLPTYGG